MAAQNRTIQNNKAVVLQIPPKWASFLPGLEYHNPLQRPSPAENDALKNETRLDPLRPELAAAAHRGVPVLAELPAKSLVTCASVQLLLAICLFLGPSKLLLATVRVILVTFT